jgi:hypothetical protein
VIQQQFPVRFYPLAGSIESRRFKTQPDRALRLDRRLYTHSEPMIGAYFRF